MKNLYYSLPDSVIYRINKMVFSIEVLPVLNKRIPHGDFSFMIPKNSKSQWDRLWVVVLKETYTRLHLIGPNAWNYLKNKKSNNGPIWNTIISAFSDYDPMFFNKSMYTMEYLAKSQWNKFVRDCSISMKLII
jgi:hypothetical protein